jgi:mannosylglycerate hydrolase
VSSSGGPPRQIDVVPHTHWDREWYDPFQTFRLKLVHLIDGLLDLLEGDPSFAEFLLDGQVAIIDDYLAIRPENEQRLRSLAAAGRLTVGPWYILMDEFLVSGETIVRDLQAGIRRGAAFGGVMDVGYLPDMFGHIAQMPQILREAGFEHTVVWRGVPSAVDTTAFWWDAPDGSRVRAEYLVAGYGNGAAIPDDAKALVRRLHAHVEEMGPFLQPGAPLLFMNGTDHQRPQPWLGRVVAEVNDLQDDYHLSITSLPKYLSTAPTDGLPVWQGELRSGVRSNLLMGVGSNRVDVKQSAARTQRALERLAEPLSALFLPAASWPGAFLDVAWQNVIRNAAHDSICACSVDEVVNAVIHRFAEARQVAEGLTDEALSAVGRSMAAVGTVVVNPSSRRRGGVVELVIPANGEPDEHTQVLSERSGLPGLMTLDGETVRGMLGLIQGARIDTDMYVTGVTLAEDETGLDVTVEIGTEARDGVPVEEIKRDLFTRLIARPDTQVRLRLDQPPIRRVLARVADVPAYGWQAFTPVPLVQPVRAEHAGTDVTLSNGATTVVVDARTGTFAIDGLTGFGRLVDGGDHGDTYNYSPPATDTVIDTPDEVTVRIGDRGPVRASAVITAGYTWPDRVDGHHGTRIGSQHVEVTTTVELRADERLVRVRTAFVNPSRDHRLRVHLPLPEPATTSRAECAFDVVERGLTAEGRVDEFGLPTFPSRRFVSAGGLTVVHEGLLEYELIDIDRPGDQPIDRPGDQPIDEPTQPIDEPTDIEGSTGKAGKDAHGPAAARTLALTLLRSTGMLSRLGMSLRPLPAGPMTPLVGPQMLGPVETRYALHIGDADPYRLVDDADLPLRVIGSFGGGERGSTGSQLTIDGAEVSAVRREAGALEVRVFNPTDSPTVVAIEDRSGWLVDLRGRPISPFEGRFDLRPHGIATVRITDG